MHIGLKAGIALVAFFVFYHLTFQHLPNIRHVEVLYAYEFDSGSMLRSDHTGDLPSFTAHRTANEKTLANHKETSVYKIASGGSDSSVFKFSTGGMDESSIALFRKPGYLTYPRDGEYFVWYPKYGDHVLFFDAAGQFLWAKQSSHYLQVLPSGQWILAAAGDHSRFFLLHPDLKERISAEGMIMLSYDISGDTGTATASTGTENASQTPESVFAAFLDGDIVVVNPALNISSRISAGGPVKSIAANANGERFIVQTALPGSNVDTIRIGHVDLEREDAQNVSADISWYSELELERSYPITLPLAVNNNAGLVMTPPAIQQDQTGHKAESPPTATVSLFTLKGDVFYTKRIPLNDENPDGNLDDWRAARAGNALVLWSSERLLVFDKTLIFEKTGNFQRLGIAGDYLFVQEKEKLSAYRISE